MRVQVSAKTNKRILFKYSIEVDELSVSSDRHLQGSDVASQAKLCGTNSVTAVTIILVIINIYIYIYTYIHVYTHVLRGRPGSETHPSHSEQALRR